MLSEAFSKQYIIEEFDDEHWYNRSLSRFEDLIRMVENRSVVPFIGAGVSKNAGFPTWKEHLIDQGKTAGIAKGTIDKYIKNGEYEEFIENIESIRNKDTFTQEIRDTFSRTLVYPEILVKLCELFDDTYITTNYDKLIELACFDVARREVQVLNRDNHGDSVDPDKTTIVKLHGDVYNQRGCILSKDQYDLAYGKDSIDLDLPIPSLLKYYYLNSNLLFMGCSLNNDRTIDVFRMIKKSLPQEEAIPQHYSIEQLPVTKKALEERNSYLAELGISGIWFEPGKFDLIVNMISLIQIELNFQIASVDISPENKVDKIDIRKDKSNNERSLSTFFSSLIGQFKK